MNNILLSQLNQENICCFFKILAQNADIPNVNLKNFDINVLKNSMDISFSTSFFVMIDDKPIGIFLSSIKADFGGILLIYISHLYRHQGLGKQMLSDGISLMKSKKVKHITLEVLPDNLNAINLYKKNNFEKCADIQFFRNETNSFYQVDENIVLKNINSLLILPTLRQFGKNFPMFYTWYYNSVYFSKLIDTNQAEFTVIYENSRIIGYFIFIRKNNTIRILDYGILNDKKDFLFSALSLLIKNERTVIFQILAKYNDDAEILLNKGFFVDIQQEIYLKNI